MRSAGFGHGDANEYAGSVYFPRMKGMTSLSVHAIRPFDMLTVPNLVSCSKSPTRSPSAQIWVMA